MFKFRRWWLLCGAVLVGVVVLNGVVNGVVDAKAIVEAPQPVGDARTQLATKPPVTMVVCVEQSSSRLYQAVANRCDTASQFKLVWPVRGAAPQVCVNTLSREMTLSSSGICRAENAFLARATAKRPFLGCADKDTGMLRWPRAGVCWWQNTSMVLMAAAQTSTTTTTTSSSTTTTSSITTTSTTTTSVPGVVAPVVVSASADDGVRVTVAGMRPDTGVYSLQWVPYGQSFNTYQMARATSASMSVPAGWFACNRTYTFRVFVMQADWLLADGHQTQNVTPHSTPFDVVMPACPAPAVPTVTCADGGVCVVGDTGPGGGKVFYVHASGMFACGATLASTCKYLEAAPNTWSAGVIDPLKPWAISTYQGSDVTPIFNDALAYNNALGIGLGYKNSLAIVAQGNDTTTAAGAARAYAGGSQSDWYLPTTAELNLLCQWARNVTQSVTTACTGGDLNTGTGASGGFSTGAYWSSSEIDGTTAWFQRFRTGGQHSAEKWGSGYVRPVRAFGGTLACADGGVCIVGDTGPGGGIVFYVASGTFTQTGAAGSMCTTACKYLEAAPTNWLTGTTGDPQRTWATNVNANQTTAVSGADGTAIGSGYQNSLDIVAQAGNIAASSAAVLAREYGGGGKTDWFLPSRDELNELCKYAKNQAPGTTATVCAGSGVLRSGFSSADYWSSSEFNATSVRGQAFYTVPGSNQYVGTKDISNVAVRPVRAFG